MSNTFAELPETHIERMDRLAFEADQKKELAQIQAKRDIEVAKHDAKGRRNHVWIGWAIAFTVAAITCTGIYAIWIDDNPAPAPEEYKQSESYREEQCYNNGGGWVPAELFYDQEQGICVFPGKVVPGSAAS